jgi:PPOX class probable FMN-dependent enzyme
MSSSDSVGLSDIGGKTTSDEGLTSWRSRIDTSIAKSRKIRGGNYVQIATVDSETNEPRCRTVVFRGFQDMPISSVECEGKPCVMKMITDNRSNKVSEATTGNSACEMVWWFSKSNEQYRIQGELKFVGSGQFELDKQLASVRKQQWGNLSDMAREQFFWKTPGLVYSGDSTVPEGGRDKEGKLLPPPDSFLLMLLFPYRVEYLRLGDNFRQIDELEGDDWSMIRVNP